MKILSTSTVSSLSLTAGTVLSAYPLANVETDQPQERAIGSAKTITIRISVSGSTDSLFLDGWLADSGSYSLDGGAATNLSSTQLEDRFGFKPWGQNLVKRKKPLYISGLSASSTIDLTLVTSTDRKGSPIQGNSISNWVQSSGADGNFTDGSSNINAVENGQVLIGGFATIGGSDYQITGIKGDATKAGDITLSSSVASGSVTALTLPVQLGILKAGTSTDLANPQAVNRTYQNFSTIRTGPAGFRLVSKRGVAETIEVTGIYSLAQADNLVGIANSQREQPVPVLMLESMTAERDLFSVFGAISIPAESYATMGGSHRNLEYLIQEVL